MTGGYDTDRNDLSRWSKEFAPYWVYCSPKYIQLKHEPMWEFVAMFKTKAAAEEYIDYKKDKDSRFIFKINDYSRKGSD